MSIQARDAVYEHSKAKGHALLVLLGLAEFADSEGSAYPHVSTLAEKVNMSRTAAMNHIAKLIASGELIHTGSKKRGAVIYRIAVMNGPVEIAESVTEADTLDAPKVSRRLTASVTEADSKCHAPGHPSEPSGTVIEPSPPSPPPGGAVSKPPPDLSRPDPVIEAIAMWEVSAKRCGWTPKAPTRKGEGWRKLERAAKARIAEHGLDGWRRALRAAERNDHANGRTAARWMLKLSSFVRPGYFQDRLDEAEAARPERPQPTPQQLAIQAMNAEREAQMTGASFH